MGVVYDIAVCLSQYVNLMQLEQQSTQTVTIYKAPQKGKGAKVDEAGISTD